MSTERNHDEDRRPRVGTIIWGLIAVVVGLLVVAGTWWNVSFNWAYVLIALLIGSGIALMVAGVLSATRNRGR